MKTVLFRDLVPDTYYTTPLYLENGYILLSPEISLKTDKIKLLADWEIRVLYTDGSVINHIPEIMESVGVVEGSDTLVTETPSAAMVTAADKEAINKAFTFYNQLLAYTETLFSKYSAKAELNVKDIYDKVKSMCDAVLKDKKFFLQVLNENTHVSEYIVSHSVRSTILAIILGAQIKLPPHRLIELGVASILHEIGMTRLPAKISSSSNPLTEDEKKLLSTHPIISYKILKDKQLPLAICLAALEHHERMNGTGYPRALSGDKISLYARIVAVACSYESVTAERPYKDIKEGFSGIVHVMQNEGKQYDEAIIRALVYSVSLYPIGSCVMLSNSSLAQVLDVNPNDPKMPIVRVLGSKTPDGKELVIRTSETGLRVLRAVPKEEVKTILLGKSKKEKP